jgi:hypothetical protein
MAAFLAPILTSLAGAGGTAAVAGTAATGTAAAAGISASSIASILSGASTAFSVLHGIGASQEEATGYELAARDAVSEQADEHLLGLQRRNALKKDFIQAVGERDIAYAASGVDVSFGTPSVAREEAQRDFARASTIDLSTEQSRVARLQERAELLRLKANSTRRGGLLEAITTGLGGASDIFARG